MSEVANRVVTLATLTAIYRPLSCIRLCLVHRIRSGRTRRMWPYRSQSSTGYRVGWPNRWLRGTTPRATGRRCSWWRKFQIRVTSWALRDVCKLCMCIILLHTLNAHAHTNTCTHKRTLPLQNFFRRACPTVAGSTDATTHNQEQNEGSGLPEHS